MTKRNHSPTSINNTRSARVPRPPRFGARNLAAEIPARQEGARFAAAPHAGRFARRAQARVVAEALGRGRGERAKASEHHPEPRRGRRRRDGGARKASPARRSRPDAQAAGLWPKRGRPSPERSEAERGSSAALSAAPRKAARRSRQRGAWEGAGAWGKGVGRTARPRTGGRRRHGGKRGQWGARPISAKGA